MRARTPRDARLIHQSGNWMVWQTWDPIPTTGFISPIIQLKKQSVYLQRVGAKDAHVLMDFVADGGPRIYTVLEDGTVLLNWRDGPQWVKLGEEARVEKPILVDKKACWILNAWQDGMVIGPVRDSSDARLPMYWLPIANGVLDRAHIRRISDNTGWGQITTPHIARHKQQLAWARVDEPERWKRTHRLFIFSLETGELSQVQTPNLAHVIAFDDTYAYSGG
ncbi:MAG: hypothetical protein HN849_31585, partial [Victivallales bacterium]|nr:hypothetical protein [Victivallales bacterium]